MKQSIKIFLLMILSLFIFVNGQERKNIFSPDGKTELVFSLSENRNPSYHIKYKGKEVVKKSALGIKFTDSKLNSTSYKIENSKTNKFDETWEPVLGTDSKVRNNYNSLEINLLGQEQSEQFSIIFRVFNDGVAFRYFYPEQNGITKIEVIDEETEFGFTANHYGWWIPQNFSWDENFYKKNRIEEIPAANVPMTLETKDGLFLAITEAAIIDYPAMTIEQKEGAKHTFKAALVPWPDGIKVKTNLPFKTPWRTLQIAETPGGLIKSHIAENLNEPCKINDVSWIKPLKFIGIWWGMHIGKWTWKAGKKHGATTENTKRYIDFAAKHKIDAVLIEGWNKGWETWDPNVENLQYYTETYDDFNINEVVSYARQKGVEIIGHHETGGNIVHYENQLDTSFAYYKKLGINSIKTGYAGNDFPIGKHHFGQFGVNHFNRVVEKAAREKIMLNVHEPIKPGGLNRTYPNLVTQEGARGNEQNAPFSGNPIPPDHQTILPFTRLLTGGFDYTHGIFKLKSTESPRYQICGTLAKELALYVVIPSPMLMIADMIENLENQPALKFVLDVPATWDRTEALNSEIGNYVTIARKKGEEWYLGSITDENSRELTIDMNFLDKDKKYIAEVYIDSQNTDWSENPSEIEIDSFYVSYSDKINIALSPAGGAAIRLRPDNGKSENIKDIKLLNISQPERIKRFKKVQVWGKETADNSKTRNAEIKYIVSPSSKYKAGGNKALIDGKAGNIFNLNNWQGFEGSNMEFIIDLKKEIPVEEIELRFIKRYINWVFIPEEVSVSFSSDLNNFEKTEKFYYKNLAEESDNFIKKFSLKRDKTKTRYIKITAKNIGICPDWHPGKGGNAWIFADEIIIR